MAKFLCAALCAAGLSMVTAVTWAGQPLLTPAQLSEQLSAPGLRVVDIRPAAEYGANHIAGAVSAPYGAWRGPADNPGKLPSVDDLTALVRRLGIDDQTHAVIVSSGANSTDFGASARVYWTLDYLGVKNLSIVNGGMKAWAAAGLPQTSEVPKVAPTSFVAHLDEAIIAPTAAVEQQLGNPKTLLLDARPHAYYVGKEKAPSVKTPGTIKGAVNLENGRWFDPGTSTFVSDAKAREIADQLLPKDGQTETISFCNTGHWAATNWFALSQIVGVKNVRLYPQSLAGWTQDPARPMQNVPSRGSQLVDDIKSVFKR